jgi:hypothetical protein
MGGLRRFQRRKEALRRVGGDDFVRPVEQKLAAGGVVAEKDEW